MWQIPVGTLGIWPLTNLKRLDKWVHWCHLESKDYSVQLFSCKEQLSYCASIMSYLICEGIRNLHIKSLWLQEVEAPRIFRQSAHEGSKVVSPMHLPLPPREIHLVLISVRG